MIDFIPALVHFVGHSFLQISGQSAGSQLVSQFCILSLLRFDISMMVAEVLTPEQALTEQLILVRQSLGEQSCACKLLPAIKQNINVM